MKFEIEAGNIIHQIGSRATQNDSYYFNEKYGIFILCDGVGSASDAKKVSAFVAYTLGERLVENIQELDGNLLLKEVLLLDVDLAKYKVVRELSPSATTTLVFLVLKHDQVFYGNIGDSRLYHFSPSGSFRRTKDHNRWQELLDLELVNEEKDIQVKRKLQNALTKVMGNNRLLNKKDVPLLSYKMEQGINRFFICSDGIFDAINETELHKLAINHNKTIAQISNWLNEKVMQGAIDNATGLFIESQTSES